VKLCLIRAETITPSWVGESGKPPMVGPAIWTADASQPPQIPFVGLPVSGDPISSAAFAAAGARRTAIVIAITVAQVRYPDSFRIVASQF
jgi:hypothetical protein